MACLQRGASCFSCLSLALAVACGVIATRAAEDAPPKASEGSQLPRTAAAGAGHAAKAPKLPRRPLREQSAACKCGGCHAAISQELAGADDAVAPVVKRGCTSMCPAALLAQEADCSCEQCTTEPVRTAAHLSLADITALLKRVAGRVASKALAARVDQGSRGATVAESYEGLEESYAPYVDDADLFAPTNREPLGFVEPFTESRGRREQSGATLLTGYSFNPWSEALVSGLHCTDFVVLHDDSVELAFQISIVEYRKRPCNCLRLLAPGEALDAWRRQEDDSNALQEMLTTSKAHPPLSYVDKVRTTEPMRRAKRLLLEAADLFERNDEFYWANNLRRVAGRVDVDSFRWGWACRFREGIDLWADEWPVVELGAYDVSEAANQIREELSEVRQALGLPFTNHGP